MLVHGLGLPALQVADEVPAEGVAVALVLRGEVLRAVFPRDLDPRLGEHGHLVRRDVLRGCDNGHARADLARMRSYRSRDLVSP